ncbi:MAG: zinc ribbon-containing protein [bacterium]|nr:zinc ribbon-containing protein [bacterium]
MATKNQTNDFTKAIENFFTTTPLDMSAFGDIAKNTAEFNSKLSQIALEAAEQNAELTSAWTKETLVKLEELTKVQKDPADYAKAVSDFTAEQAQTSPEHVAAFAEVAKKTQMETVELLMAGGKDLQAKATAATTKKAS